MGIIACMEEKRFYVVTTEADDEGRTRKIIGYAAGREDDIRAYYADRKNRNLYLDSKMLVFVTPESVAERNILLDLREKLKTKLETLDTRLE